MENDDKMREPDLIYTRLRSVFEVALGFVGGVAVIVTLVPSLEPQSLKEWSTIFGGPLAALVALYASLRAIRHEQAVRQEENNQRNRERSTEMLMTRLGMTPVLLSDFEIATDTRLAIIDGALDAANAVSTYDNRHPQALAWLELGKKSAKTPPISNVLTSPDALYVNGRAFTQEQRTLLQKAVSVEDEQRHHKMLTDFLSTPDGKHSRQTAWEIGRNKASNLCWVTIRQCEATCAAMQSLAGDFEASHIINADIERMQEKVERRMTRIRAELPSPLMLKS